MGEGRTGRETKASRREEEEGGGKEHVGEWTKTKRGKVVQPVPFLVVFIPN